MSLLVRICMFIYSVVIFNIVITRDEYQLSQALKFNNNFENFGNFSFEENKIRFQMVDPLYDNDDNPYVKLRLRRSHNLGSDGEYQKDYIPMAKCGHDEIIPEFQRAAWYSG